MTFDQMVDKFLPYLNETTREAASKADPPKNYAKVFEMFRAGRFKTLERDYIGDDGRGMFENPGIVINRNRHVEQKLFLVFFNVICLNLFGFDLSISVFKWW